MEQQTGGNLADHYPVSGKFQRGRHLERDRQYPWCAAGNRICLLVLFFRGRRGKDLRKFYRSEKPEHALKLFIRFALAKGVVTYGLELMMALFRIVQGIVSTIMDAAGFGSAQETVLPQEIITAVEDCGFFESIPLWASR